MRLTFTLQNLSSNPFIIKLPSSNILCVFPFPLPHCSEVMSPSHEGRNILHSPCCSICGLTRGSQGILNGDGLAAEHLPLSNYMTASREGELLLHDPFMVPNIPFLFIPNLFVQRSPLMLAAPSSVRHCERGNWHQLQAVKKKKKKSNSCSNHTY